MGTGTILLQQHQDQYFELSYCHPESCNTPRQFTTVGFEMGRMYAFVLPSRLGSLEADAETECEGKLFIRDQHLWGGGDRSQPGLERTWWARGQPRRQLWSDCRPLKLCWWQAEMAGLAAAACSVTQAGWAFSGWGQPWRSSPRGPVQSFPGVAITSHHKLGGLKVTNLSSQFWRPEVQRQGVDRGHSFWRLWRETVPCFSPSFCWLLALLGIPWLRSLPLSSHGLPLCVSVVPYFSVPSKKTLLIGFRAPPHRIM